jgi:hypothetical protein
MAESPLDIDALDIAALRGLILDLLEQGVARDAENAVLRDEIRRLKGLNGPPDIKPSGMDKKARSRAKAGRTANKRRRGSKKCRVVIDEKRVVMADRPQGSRFKGYEDYLIQDLIC